MGRVYTLLLENNKYYIGFSNNFIQRIYQHFNNIGASWTQLHPVKKILRVQYGTKLDEVHITQKMMRKHGIENVRGGPWCAIELYEDPFSYRSQLYRDHVNDRCYKCARRGHFAKQCRAIEVLICHCCNGRGHYARECHFNFF